MEPISPEIQSLPITKLSQAEKDYQNVLVECMSYVKNKMKIPSEYLIKEKELINNIIKNETNT